MNAPDNDRVHLLDMGKTIEFYDKHNLDVAPIPDAGADIGEFLKLLPEQARERAILRNVSFAGPMWFDKETSNYHLATAIDKNNAISPTAFAPSYTHFTDIKNPAVSLADISMFRIEPDAVSARARRVIEKWCMLHELGHTLVFPANYVEGYSLQMPDGKVVHGADLMFEFASIAENHAPITRYSSFYREKDNKFGGPFIATGIDEELCESIAAHQMGFAFCGDEFRSFNPFNDRPEVKEFVSNFLNARVVRK